MLQFGLFDRNSSYVGNAGICVDTMEQKSLLFKLLFL